MALLGVLLILFLVTGLIAGLTVSGQTEIKIASNYEAQAKAQMAAEAGLNHAVAVTIAYLNNYQANGFATPKDAMTRLYRGPDNNTGTTATDADNGSLVNLGIPTEPATTALTTDTTYRARVFDEDDPNRGLTLSAADRTRIGETTANAYSETNSKLVVRAIGNGPGNTTVMLEAILGVTVGAAILVNGNLDISGNPDILGSAGGVHANGNLSISGNPTVSQNCTASGTYSASGNPTCGGTTGGGQPAVPVPSVQASAHLAEADYILNTNDTITNQAGTVLCSGNACDAAYGWKLSGGKWDSGGNNMANGTFYVRGSAKISGNAGSAATPKQVTIISEGTIEISGNPWFVPDTNPNAGNTLLFLADGDLVLNGNFNQGATSPEVQILVREQLKISGGPSIRGQIIVENAASVFNDVTGNSTISGNFTNTYNGSVTGGGGVVAQSWREMP